MKRAGNFLLSLSGWMLLATVAAGPWMMGSLPPRAIAAIETMLAAASVSWLLGLMLQRRWPAINGLVVLGMILVGLGWAVTLHPIATYASDARQFIGNGASGAGTLDGFTSRLTMESVTALFGAFWMGSDLFKSARLRRRFLWTLSISGASVAVLGILQHAGVSTFLLDWMSPHEGQPFGPFNYHGNAGAFLLMGLAAGLGLAAAAFAGGRRRAAMLAGLAVLVTLAGICMSTSRTAVVLALVMMPALASAAWRMFAPALARPAQHARKIGWGITGGLLLAAGMAFFCMPGKWRLLLEQLSGEHGRYVVWRIGAGMAKDAGWFGLGPATFGLMLPLTPRFEPELFRLAIVTYQVPGDRVSMWVHAHNDLLQAFVEWGWIGGMLWTVAAAMAVRKGIQAVWRRGAPAMERVELAGAFAGLSVVMLQSLVDFPFGVLALQLPAVLCAACLAAGVRTGGPMETLAVERMETRVRIRGAGAHHPATLVRKIPHPADNPSASAPNRENPRQKRDR